MLKRAWNGSKQCLFCALDDSIDHLFFHCPVAKYIWGVFHCALGVLKIPNSVSGLGVWVLDFHGSDRVVAKVYLAAIFWTI